MKAITFLTCLMLAAGISVSKAQSADDLVREWERAKAYTKAYLDAMPADGYALKPTPEMRSFADQMLHLTDANLAFAAAASGRKSTATGSLEKTTDKSKETVSKEVLAAYDFVIEGIKGLSPEQLNEKIKLFGKFDLTRGQAFQKAFEHQTHHRGQTTVYLRLAKATPPEEQLF